MPELKTTPEQDAQILAVADKVEDKLKAQNDGIKKLNIDGYEFTVDTDLLDDVEAFEHIDRIENKGQVAAIVPLLHFLIGKDGYGAMKAHFVKIEGRFRVTKLSKVYQVIIDNFNPKG